MSNSLLSGQIPGGNPSEAAKKVIEATQTVRAPLSKPTGREVNATAVTQRQEGQVYMLRIAAKLETSEMRLQADEIDYHLDTGYAEGRGHVVFDNLITNYHLEADLVQYDSKGEKGKFFNVRGSSPAKVDLRPGLLRTTNPFYFQGKWAERFKDRYVLHDGFVTNCKLPRPWWILRAPLFDIVPEQHAIARSATFLLKSKVPLFYAPAFYKSLEEEPRKSGFLMPNAGSSSRRGWWVKAGYYWAINRSYDALYTAQYFTKRGLAHTVDFRGKPNQKTDFDFFLYGVNDKGLEQDDGSRIKQGGYLMTVRGKSSLKHGFEVRVDASHLSSFVFRQAFTESYFEAISSEVRAVGSIYRHWSTFGLVFAADQITNFQKYGDEDKIVIRKLPVVDFSSRDRQIAEGPIPLWLSWRSSAGLFRRSQFGFSTAQFVDRLDLEPEISTAIHWKDVHLLPSFSLRETHYGARYHLLPTEPGSPQELASDGTGLNRFSREFNLDLVLPSFARVFETHNWLGEKVKHVIEPRAHFRAVGGVDQYLQTVRFDATDLITNTKEIEYSITQRLFSKRKDGHTAELMSWMVAQQRYLDPTFGGAVSADRRNLILSQSDLTGMAFLDGPRSYSPIISAFRVSPLKRLRYGMADGL